MKIAILGLWHLGCVTAACCARHFNVVGLTSDDRETAALQSGRAPLFEPGLDSLLQSGIAAGRLSFTENVRQACDSADILWITHDTPVDGEDRADVEFVLKEIRRVLPALDSGALVLVSSQLPVGTCRQLAREFGGRWRFACSPENLRLGKALEIFSKAERVIVGCDEESTKSQLAELFAPFTQHIVWMRPESAEMTKHAINSFLAVSITFMNEIANLCEVMGADAKEVERGLKSESRIGPKAYLSPGGPFAGGTLARDVVTLTELGERRNRELAVIPAIRVSNERHRRWSLNKIQAELPTLAGNVIVLLGLTYKAGTNTLRRSSAIDLARKLRDRDAIVRAFDPSYPSLTSDLAFIQLCKTSTEAVTGADAVVVCTEWREFKSFEWPALVKVMRRRLFIDPSRFLAENLEGIHGIRYLAVGSPA